MVIPYVPATWTAGQRRRHLDALLAYVEAPGPQTADELWAAAPGVGDQALGFARALVGYPGSAWTQALHVPATIEPTAPEEPSPIALAHRGPRRSRPPAMRWAAAAAAVIALAAGATALVVAGHSATPPKAPTPTLAAAWRLAGHIDQPAWQVASSGGAPLSPFLSCSGPTTCFAGVTSGAGSTVVESSVDGGVSWEAHALPSGVQLTAALTCFTPSACVGAGIIPSTAGSAQAVSVVTSDGGSSWDVHPLPAGVARVVALSCPAAPACVGVGFAGAPSSTDATASGQAIVVTSANAGISWSTHQISQPIYPGAASLACSSPADCVLAGTTTQAAADHPVPTTAAILSTDDGGATWTEAALPSALGSVQAVSCAPGGGCVAFANREPGSVPNHYAVLRSATAEGRSWQVATGAGFALAFVSSVSCPAPGACWASGRSAPTATEGSVGAVAATNDGGTSWVEPAMPNRLTASAQQVLGAPELDLVTVPSVSCPAVDLCVALGAAQLTGPTAARVVLRSDGA